MFLTPFLGIIKYEGLHGIIYRLTRATDLMNNRPRKCLGLKTPFEVFAQMTGKDYFLNQSVALIS